ncbi:hypothetical protein EVAR_88218_1 [Eumeta japonica]|uniref:Uncharacterized protein n=1 Tax=Eumeta variegata TaxID=151549 RepID=A0A4C1YXB7_EUMVA|nr:hypothetical protein EVAR_88218_1 [Eumeta japonica]
MRCAAHTFNLVASKDVNAALQITVFKIPYRSCLAKARTLWNQQSCSTVAADSIHAELGRRLVLPNTTRWNSLYDATVILNGLLETKRPSLHSVMTQLKILTFNDQDVTVMKEYAKVMAPVANALDRIQGEAQAYLGSLLPTIAATVYKLKNIKSKGLVNCTALANALLNGIEKRHVKTGIAASKLGRFRPVFTEDQEIELVTYLKDMDSVFFGLTRDEFKNLAFIYVKKNDLNYPNNWDKYKKAGDDWLSSFLSRHDQISLRTPEATSVARAKGFNRHEVGRFYENLEALTEKYNIDASSLYNMDETGISTTTNKPPKVLSAKGKKQVGIIASAERGQLTTVIGCCKAAGSFLPPFLIFARKRCNQTTGWRASRHSRNLYSKWLDFR